MTKHIGYNTRDKREVKTPPQIMLYKTSIKHTRTSHETTNHTIRSKHKSKHKLHNLPLFVIHQKRDKLARKLSYSITQTLSSPHIKENLLKSSGLVKISASCKFEET